MTPPKVARRDALLLTASQIHREIGGEKAELTQLLSELASSGRVGRWPAYRLSDVWAALSRKTRIRPADELALASTELSRLRRLKKETEGALNAGDLVPEDVYRGALVGVQRPVLELLLTLPDVIERDFRIPGELTEQLIDDLARLRVDALSHTEID